LEENEDPVDTETFVSRLSPQSVAVGEDGRVQVFFGDGDLFWGHAIIVAMNDALEPTDAEIAG
jgi:hypothetical protein